MKGEAAAANKAENFGLNRQYADIQQDATWWMKTINHRIL